MSYVKLDKDMLYQDLLEAFIEYQYNIENPMPSTYHSKETRTSMYLSDAVFHRKVQSLVAGVMCIVEKHVGVE